MEGKIKWNIGTGVWDLTCFYSFLNIVINLVIKLSLQNFFNDVCIYAEYIPTYNWLKKVTESVIISKALIFRAICLKKKNKKLAFKFISLIFFKKEVNFHKNFNRMQTRHKVDIIITELSYLVFHLHFKPYKFGISFINVFKVIHYLPFSK